MVDAASFRAGVILPAAGMGTRFGGQVKKQFQELDGRAVVELTLERFLAIEHVENIVVAVPAQHLEHATQLLQADNQKIKIVIGGATRNESVRRAFREIPEVDVVVIHDAVRPFISRQKIIEVMERAYRDGAASLAIPVTDTLRRVTDGKFGETVDRSGLWRMQTPQAFRTELLTNAFQASNDIAVTDEVELLRGITVSLVEGDKTNMKITTAEDFAIGLSIRSHQTDNSR